MGQTIEKSPTIKSGALIYLLYSINIQANNLFIMFIWHGIVDTKLARKKTHLITDHFQAVVCRISQQKSFYYYRYLFIDMSVASSSPSSSNYVKKWSVWATIQGQT